MDNAFFAKLMEFKEVIQGMISNTGSGWATTGTTTLTGDVTIDQDGHGVEFSGAVTVNDLGVGGDVEVDGGAVISGEVGIGGAAVGGVALNVVGDSRITPNTVGMEILVGSNKQGIKVKSDNTGGYGFVSEFVGDESVNKIGDFNGDNNNTYIEVNDITANKFIELSAAKGIKANQAISAYANNAAAVAAIGTGKMYYTDVAGEYLIKLSH
jgi:hypothetical protein